MKVDAWEDAVRVVVLTVDQRASRSTPDLVPRAVADYGSGALRGFERTAGDEIQGVFDDPAAVTATLLELLRSDAWYVGVGIGTVETPLPRQARAGRGPAYLHARTAVDGAKRTPGHVAVVGDDDYRAGHVETALLLWAALLGRRTTRGWEVVDLVDEGLSYDETARRLGISPPAVSQRARAAGLVEGRRARSLVTDLLAETLTGHPPATEDAP
ncbi:helix-turn-helix domain-containing protein [Nocardioides donggukensis]|uniref:Transposase n=1 Tax=Nocardioides donggukensis TaxID=2774019 RepID=A0A927PZG9_9ACTN|nr:helix-turn-helix domain-containing protein [Nocardioides donggukensis]MBD8869100.1 transposase [Nocardioides donggukensis]